jgi:hypothetical protein
MNQIKNFATSKNKTSLYNMSRVILLIGLGLGNKKAPGRGAFFILDTS